VILRIYVATCRDYADGRVSDLSASHARPMRGLAALRQPRLRYIASIAEKVIFKGRLRSRLGLLWQGHDIATAKAS